MLAAGECQIPENQEGPGKQFIYVLNFQVSFPQNVSNGSAKQFMAKMFTPEDAYTSGRFAQFVEFQPTITCLFG